MNIILVYQYFLSDGEPGHTRWNEMVKNWSDAGHKITIISGMINYSTGKKNLKYNNKIFYREKYYSNVDVIRCHVSKTYNKNFLGRLWGYFSFIIFGLLGAILFLKGKYNVVVVSSPPLFVGIIGLMIKKIKKIPMIFEIRDLWPESAIETGVVKNKLIIKLSYWLENYIYNNSKLINVLTPAFKKSLINTKNIAKKKIIYIPNAADFRFSESYKTISTIDFRKSKNWLNKFVIIYVGAHGLANNLFKLLDLADKISNKKAHFVLIGDGMMKNKLLKEREKRNLTNVEFIDPMPKDEIFKYILSSDAGISILQKNKVFKTIYSNKTFDYMSCKKPIIMCIDGVSRELVEDSNSGFYIDPDDYLSFSRKINQLIEDEKLCSDLGENGFRYAKKYFDRNSLSNKYLKKIKDIV